MYDDGKSDRPIVPQKLTNNSGHGEAWPHHPVQPPAESVEGRGRAEGNARQDAGSRTQNRATPQDALTRIRQAVDRDKRMRLTTLWHHVYSTDRLSEAYFALDSKAAPGIDGQTWHDYGQDLQANLQDLATRLKRGSYRARPVRRVWIPKADGRQRPIGVPTLEDKIVQRATCQVLSAVYEADFLGFSYGFRPGRSAHQALDALAVGIEHKRVNWILDADIRGFFDTIDHEWLIQFVEHRIADRRVIRHLKKWLRAGVLEDSRRVESKVGTPQGGSVSPLLANIYLHYAFDLWAHQWRKKHARGDVIIVRYADDFVVGFEQRAEAEQFLEQLRERLAQFKLELHPDKTRLIEFGRDALERRKRNRQGKPEIFDFLGFTHACDRTRRGDFTVLRFPSKKKMRAKLKALKDALRRRLNRPVVETGKWLTSVLRGWYRYYAVPRTYRWLDRFRRQVVWLWRQMLRRRSQKDRTSWSRMYRLIDRWLPKPRILHPYPDQRLAGMTASRSPVR